MNSLLCKNNLVYTVHMLSFFSLFGHEIIEKRMGLNKFLWQVPDYIQIHVEILLTMKMNMLNSPPISEDSILLS